MEIETITVRSRQSPAFATQYLGQEGFENVFPCTVDSAGILHKAKPNARVIIPCMGYEKTMGFFVPIYNGDWVVTVEHAATWPFPRGNETFILSDPEFHARYEKE